MFRSEDGKAVSVESGQWKGRRAHALTAVEQAVLQADENKDG